MTKSKKDNLPLLTERPEKIHTATKHECIEDLRNIQYANPDKFISRNFYRVEGGLSDSAWEVHFGTFTEFKSQAGLQETRQGRKMEVDVAKHASQDHLHEYFKTEILPFNNLYNKSLPGKLKTMLICSDLHDIEIDLFCLSVFIDTCKRTQPDIIVFNGDIFDLYEFSKYHADPRHCKLEERFRFVKEKIFKAVRDACPNAQIDFILGNHEWRLIKHLADKSPFMRVLLGDVMNLSLADIFGVHEFQINLYSKADLKAFSLKNQKSEQAKNYKIYFGCYVVSHIKDRGFGMSGTNGHHHQISVESDYNVVNGPITWVQTPGMHQLDAEYLDFTCKWNLGFLRVFINTETKNVIQQPIAVQDGWAIVDGIYYSRK